MKNRVCHQFVDNFAIFFKYFENFREFFEKIWQKIRKFDIFVCMRSARSPEASEFIKILDDISRETCNLLEKFHKYERIFDFHKPIEIRIRRTSWILDNLKESERN